MKRFKSAKIKLSYIGYLAVIFILLTACSPAKKMELPSSSELNYIEFSKDDTKQEVDDKEDMEKWLGLFVDAKATRLESVNDCPNVDEYVTINFSKNDGSLEVVYAYEKDGKYYLEKPYEGIWEIDKGYYEKVNHMTVI